MRIVTIITARGGSKRLPKKNILPLHGMPLLAHSITYPKAELGNDHQVFVSTDSPEIAEVARRYGAEVIDRPAELASDTATSASVTQHAAHYLIDHGIDFDYMVNLQPTNPLRPKGALKEIVKVLNETCCSSLVSYTDSHKKLLRRKGDSMVPVNYFFGQRSQDMEKFYFENGLFYAMSRETALKGFIQEPNSYPFIIDHPYANVDIDTIDDFRLAEVFLDLYE